MEVRAMPAPHSTSGVRAVRDPPPQSLSVPSRTPPLLTIAEAAELLNVSEHTVRSLCRMRKLRHERHGTGRGVIRISVEAIEEYRVSVTVGAGEGGSGQKPVPARPALK